MDDMEESPLELISQGFTQVMEGFGLLVNQALSLITETIYDWSDLLSTCNRLNLNFLSEEKDRTQALCLELVSPRVVKLSRSKRAKVRNKNMNRIRKELRKYEQRKKL